MQEQSVEEQKYEKTSLLLWNYVKVGEHSPNSTISARTKEAITEEIFCNFNACVNTEVLL